MVAAMLDGLVRSGDVSLVVESGDALDVREFSVQEALSSLFTLRIIARSSHSDVDLSRIVGQKARFELGRGLPGAGRRGWSGICSHAEVLEAEPTGLSTYELTIVPELWLLTQRRNHRIFQQLSEPEIVLELLEGWGIEPDNRLAMEDYPARRYRVQYAESDFAFMSRMLEDAGITFLFEDKEGETKIVLTDKPHQAEPRLPPIAYIASPNDMLDQEFVTALRLVQQVRPGRYTMRDHDYRRAPEFPLAASATSGSDLETRLERYHYVPGAFLFRGTGDGTTPSADDRGVVRADLEAGQRQAARRLEAKRGSGRVCVFMTSASDLGPGTVVSIAGHPRSELTPGNNVLVVASTITGSATSPWTHWCETRFVDVPYRPALATARPKTEGMESATVVGPEGEEIHTDEFGRVRVHFHWDRLSERNERSSCWIHVSQSWGGGSFGGMNLPRVGQEVLVDFLGGDPDRPIVVGRVFTNTQRVPYELPRYRMVTTLRSETTPRRTQAPPRPGPAGPRSSALGGGTPMDASELDAEIGRSRHFQATSPNGGAHRWSGSEITMDDTQGSERLYLQSERDMNVVAKNAMTVVVGNHRAVRVGTDDILNVTNKQSVDVGDDRSVTVGGKQTHRITGDDLSFVGKNRIHMTDETHSNIAKEHRFVGEELITLRVGSSMIVMRPDFIVVQANDVFINPGDNAAALAIEGIRPETPDQVEARRRREAVIAARRWLESRGERWLRETPRSSVINSPEFRERGTAGTEAYNDLLRDTQQRDVDARRTAGDSPRDAHLHAQGRWGDKWQLGHAPRPGAR